MLLSSVDCTSTVGKSGESGKLLPGKFDHFEGNYDFSHKEIHKTLKEIRNLLKM